MIRVLAVDDHPLLREGIAALVENHSDMELSPKPRMGARRSNSFAGIAPTLL